MKRRKLIVLLLSTAAAFVLLWCNVFYPQDPSKHYAALNENNVSREASPKEPENKVINIALFGVDTGREKYEATHSDAIMVLSIDKVYKKIKLTSFMRDTYVEIEGHNKSKLNSAYALGGPELAVKTINQNFGLDITDYAIVDFVGLSHIVDTMGGVEVEVKKQEIQEINKYMEEVAQMKKEKPTPVRKSGLQLLNGNQATAYARIRKVGEGDFDRAERQKNVLSALFRKLEDQDMSKYPSIAATLLSYVKTSLSAGEIASMGIEVLTQKIGDIDWYRFPLYGYCKGEIIHGVWYLTTDLSLTREHVHQFIYRDVKVQALKESF
ncbi:MAG TPA: LCP family protein [Candidatus Nitrosocosmicus sp.]|nr:LCP family protein [Candidatus Nitrosocosmicus sp.]